MAALSRVSSQGPRTAFPGRPRGAGGNILQAGRERGPGRWRSWPVVRHKLLAYALEHGAGRRHSVAKGD